MNCIRTIQDKTILFGRVFQNQLQVMVPEGIHNYSIQSELFTNAKDVLILGKLEDDTIIPEQAIPLSINSKFLQDTENNIEIFYVQETDIITRKQEQGYISIVIQINHISYELHICGNYQPIFTPVFLLKNKNIWQHNQLIYEVEQII